MNSRSEEAKHKNWKRDHVNEEFIVGRARSTVLEKMRRLEDTETHMHARNFNALPGGPGPWFNSRFTAADQSKTI
uniref:Uncharacterized protein n=1 Tax=Oryza rufipogon TaxID=4529 RepID=A0A0E0P6R6_ORYRU